MSTQPFRNLSNERPDIASQADGWDPATVSVKSGQKLGWKCVAGHKWEAAVANRTNGSGCPYCSNKRILVGFNDLTTSNPTLAAQAHNWDPATVTPGSSRNVEWICNLGHVWTATIINRVKGSGCPYCSGHKPIAGTNDLATTNPSLALEADGWDPTTVSAGSSQKLQWRCSSGHSWKATVSNRSNGTGCPYCSGHKPIAGTNDLATTNPSLALEADGWDPTTVSAGSSQKLQWRCSSGHSWKATVSERSRGNGCPFCSGQKVLVGFNDLATINPSLASEAYGWDPTTITAGSGKRLQWRCSGGHSWTAVVGSRHNGHGCPYCSGHKPVVGFNDLATINPSLASEAYGWDPSNVTAMSGTKQNWKCKFGHTWNATVSSRSQGSGCPKCSGRDVIPNVNDLATLNPTLAQEANGWDPSTVTSSSGKRRSWKCKLGHVWDAPVSARAQGNGCPICANQTVLAGFNDLASAFPELINEVDGWDPTSVTPKSGRKVNWICRLGHKWSATPSSRVNGNGCPTCSNRKVLVGFNDLTTTDPDLAVQAHQWDPKTVTAGSEKKLAWQCDFGHVWLTTVANRKKGSGCLVCNNQQVLPGFNDLETLFPEIAKTAFNWDPKTVTPKSGKKAEWICNLGHVWTSIIASRTKGHGCPQCSGHSVITGTNDLATVNPALAQEADGWDPTVVMPGTPKKMNWICAEGHKWSASVASRSRGNGCPFCATRGFQPSSDGWLYLIFNDSLDMYQVGITNVPDRRLAEHRKNGFDQVLDLRGPMDGIIAQHLERNILQSLLKRGARFAHKTDITKFDGWTEAWQSNSYEVTNIKQLLDLVHQDD